MTSDRLLSLDRETLENEGELNSLAIHGPVAGNNVGLRDDTSDRGVVDLRDLLRGLDPIQRPGVWVYAELPKDAPCPAGTVFTVMENEGRTVVLLEDDARNAGLQPLFRAAWITLCVHSALEAFGLVVQVSSRLADVGMPCNIIAGARHDHILVPYDEVREALKALRDLQLQG